MTCWLSALGETEESATGEYVHDSESAGSSEGISSLPGAANTSASASSPSLPCRLSSTATPASPVFGPGSPFNPWDSSDDDMSTDDESGWPQFSPISATTAASSLYDESSPPSNKEAGWGPDDSAAQLHGSDNDAYWAANHSATDADWALSTSFANSDNTLHHSHVGLTDGSADIYYNDDETAEPVELGWGAPGEGTPDTQRLNAVCSSHTPTRRYADDSAHSQAHPARFCPHYQAY